MILFSDFLIIFIQLTIFVNSARHVCGGNSQLQVIHDLFGENPHSNNGQKLEHTLNTCRKKAGYLEIHAKQLLNKYRQSRIIMNSQRILSAVAPDCMNYISTEQLENAIWTETGALLREQFIIFKEIIAILTTMEDEEYSNENTYELYHDLRTLRSDSQQLLCEIYIAIDLSGSPVPDRELSASVPLCIATGRLDRYERDYLLINRIKRISKLLQNQYIEL